MRKCIIMRGIPGSGKSTWVNKNFRDALIPSVFHVYSTDWYFTDDEGFYRFNPEKLSENHNRCLEDFASMTINLSRRNVPDRTLIVDNTNVRLFEIAPYYRIAEAFGYAVEIVWVQCDVQRAIARNVHDVPENIIRNMANSFEPIPHFWNQTIVIGG